MEAFRSLHPAVQATLIVVAGIVAVVYILALFTDVFHSRRD
jgi:hypothetical protein